MIQKVVNRARDEESGFTLIELLVVVIIIGILAAIAIPVFLNQRKKGWESAVKSDLRNYAIVMETHLTDEGTYEDLPAPPARPAPVTSNGVVLTVKAATADTYCVEGYHNKNSGDVWKIQPGAAGLTKAAC